MKKLKRFNKLIFFILLINITLVILKRIVLVDSFNKKIISITLTLYIIKIINKTYKL